jgi:hypothetical protein
MGEKETMGGCGDENQPSRQFFGALFPSHVRPYPRQAARPILDGVKVIVMTVILLLLGGALVVYLNRLSRDHSRTAEETSVRGQSEMRTHGLAMLRSRRKASKNAPAP